MNIYGVITEKEVIKVPVKAGMQYLPGSGKITSMKIRTIGYDIIEFTYDVNPACHSDKSLIAEKRIKRVIYKNI